jgi:hypothetical protein
MRWSPGDRTPDLTLDDVLAFLGVTDRPAEVQREAIRAAVEQGALGEHAVRALTTAGWISAETAHVTVGRTAAGRTRWGPAESRPSSAGTPDWLLRQWQLRATLALFAYNRAADRARSWDARGGATAAIITAVTATAIFATLKENVSILPRVIFGVVTIAAAVLSGLRATAALPARIESYEQAARRYGALRREIESVRLEARLNPSGAETALPDIERIRAELDEAAAVSPNAPQRIWNRARRHVKGEFTWLERVEKRLRGLPEPDALGADEPRVGESSSELSELAPPTESG